MCRLRAAIADEVGALVFDIGHHSIRAGYAGEDSPKAEIPSNVGVINEPIENGMMDVDGTSPQRKMFFGTNELHYARKGMDVTTFLKDGMGKLSSHTRTLLVHFVQHNIVQYLLLL